MRLCNPERMLLDSTRGKCDPYTPGNSFNQIPANEGFLGPLITFVNLNGTEVSNVPDQFGNLPIQASIVVRISAVDVLTGRVLDQSEMVGVATMASAPVTSPTLDFTSTVVRHVVDLARPGL